MQNSSLVFVEINNYQRASRTSKEVLEFRHQLFIIVVLNLNLSNWLSFSSNWLSSYWLSSYWLSSALKNINID